MEIHDVPCTVAALIEEERIVEVRLESDQEKSILGNIYTGQVENIASNIQAAFIQIEPGKRCYYPLAEAQRAVFSAGRKGNGPLRPGDELLVQVSRDSMKGKLPALTSNLNFTGRYLVLTTGDKKFGLSSKLTQEDRRRLSGWLKEEADRPDKEFGIIVRTNAADASKEEILKELEWLKGRYHKAVVQGRNRTCFSLVLETEPFYVAAVRDAYGRDLDEIITDVPEIREMIQGYLEEISPELKEKLRFYQGDIADYEGVSAADMVVTLHACDTATDYALAKAVEWGAKVILSVPCCQHEINRQIKNEMLEPILKYGILKERMSALFTDGIRANLLESMGYETQILEFIDMEHTPKNLLIRAVKTGNKKDMEKAANLMEVLNISPTLERLLHPQGEVNAEN